jgi:glutathione S-transferase
MTEWLALEEGLKASGLRIAPVRAGVPSPWSELCRALYRVNHIPFSLISARDPKRGLADLRAATTYDTLPVVFWDSERPLASWLEQLSLAERLAAAPRLLPADPVERAKVIGFLAELCMEDGFGWNRRIMMIQRLLTESQFGERGQTIGRYLADKYGYAYTDSRRAEQKCEAIVAAFITRLAARRPYFLGDTLTALDLGWAAFAALIRPLPQDMCPMTEMWRDLYSWTPKQSSPPEVEALLNRRHCVYRDWMEIPVVTQ